MSQPNFRRKLLLFVVAFALANIALASIINFHQNRIFGMELAKIDKYFIKKDDSYHNTSVYSKILKNYKNSFDFSATNNHTNISDYCYSDFSLVFPFVIEGFNSEITPSIAPIRGSPLC